MNDTPRDPRPLPEARGQLSRRSLLASMLAATAGAGLGLKAHAKEAAVTAAGGAPATALPSRVALMCSEDPARLQRVAWRPGNPEAKALAQLLPAPAGSISEAEAVTVEAGTDVFNLPQGAPLARSSAAFTNLTPGTAYCYRVGDGASWSSWHTFRTAPEGGGTFRFLYFGDVQTDIRSQAARTLRAGWQAAPDARFAVFAGDLVNHGFNDSQWDEFHEALGFMSGSMPLLPTPGNHDTKRETPAEALAAPYSAAPAYHANFALPQNGPDIPELKGEAYYVDYQGVRVISINSNVLDDDRPLNEKHRKAWDGLLAWLEAALRDNPNRWTVTTHHHPIYSGSEGRDNEGMRSLLRPLYDRYRVDLVLQGHDHCYCRTHKVSGDRVVAADAPGTVYMVSVAGPKLYTLDPKFKDLMAASRGRTQMYHTVDVTPDRLTVSGFAANGEPVDAFALSKDASGKSTLTPA